MEAHFRAAGMSFWNAKIDFFFEYHIIFNFPLEQFALAMNYTSDPEVL